MKTEPTILDIKDSSRVNKMAFYPKKEVKGIVVGNMEVTFNSGQTYRYYNIVKPVFDHIVTSNSIGRALQVIVADKSIRYEKLD